MTSIQEVREEILQKSTEFWNTNSAGLRNKSEALDWVASLLAKLEDEQAKRIEELKTMLLSICYLYNTDQDLDNLIARATELLGFEPGELSE